MSESPLFLENHCLKDYSTLGIGGPARYFIEAASAHEMQFILRYCKAHKLRTFILGKGSNTLFDDRGFDGVVILNKIDFINDLGGGVFHVGAGTSFSRLGTLTARQGWSGLEFASGIPGSVGGAVYMNAGANGSETCDTLRCVDFIDESGNLHLLEKKKLSFKYRTSNFQSMKGAIVGAAFALSPSETAREKQIEIINARTKTQPYKEKSAGCMFRNPAGKHAGALIDQCGLKGFQVGGAKVSEKHANFLVNAGSSTSKDLLNLIDEVKKQVKEKHGIEMETEVRYIPYRDV